MDAKNSLHSDSKNSLGSPSSTPVALCITLFIVFVLLTTPLYTSDDIYLLVAAQALRGASLAVVLIPLFLLLAVQLMSLPRRSTAPPSKFVPFSEVGGSSLGIAFMLVFVLALIWWQPALY